MNRATLIQRLRAPVTALVAVLIAATAVVTVSTRYHEALQRDHRRATAQLADTRGRIQALHLNAQWLEQFGPAFQRLIDNGVVGPERRLDWAERLKQSAADIGLTTVNYEIKPREVMDMPAVRESGFQVFQSAMDIKADLLHGLDLTRLLAHLDHGGLALVMPERCDIKRIRTQERLDPRPSLEANCRLWWVTIDKRQGFGAADTDES